MSNDRSKTPPFEVTNFRLLANAKGGLFFAAEVAATGMHASVDNLSGSWAIHEMTEVQTPLTANPADPQLPRRECLPHISAELARLRREHLAADEELEAAPNRRMARR